MTKQAIEKLTDKTRNRLELIANMILHWKTTGNERGRMEDSKRLRGYLICLKDMDILTDSEMRCLFLYYNGISKPFEERI